MSEVDRSMMAIALREGRRGRPSPNPHVGAVIARGEDVIAVGHHARAGAAHAEVAAIAAAGGDTEGATLYCTLEPCNHHGRTPPCTEAILDAKIARVVVATRDPKPHVPGALARLEAAGVEVVSGVREAEGDALIRDFARHIVHGLPFVTLKAAVTLDGRTAARTGDSKWITGEAARREAHAMRDRADAVLVGAGTALTDDPALTVRHVEGRDPIRVVLDTHLRLPDDLQLLRGGPPTWILHGPGAPRRAFGSHVTTIEVPLDGDRIAIEPALRELAKRDVVRLLVEGGPTVHGAILDAGLAQRAAVFVAPVILGDPGARPLAEGQPIARIADGRRLASPTWRTLDEDALIEGDIP